MIIDGRAISKEILEEIRASRTRELIVRAVTVSPDAATQSYLRIKTRAAEAAGMTLEIVQLDEFVSTEDVIAAVQAPGADAVIVQLPLPAHLNTNQILNAIPEDQDADVLSQHAHEQGTLVPPVAAAVEEILMRGNIEIENATVAVVGEGRLVGLPVAQRLAELGAHVISYDEHSFTPDILKNADIIVSGAGVPALITPDMLSGAPALIDAGTSEQGGALVGDIDPACAENASLYTPVPGGVGPVTVACLFRNVAALSLRQQIPDSFD